MLLLWSSPVLHDAVDVTIYQLTQCNILEDPTFSVWSLTENDVTTKSLQSPRGEGASKTTKQTYKWFQDVSSVRLLCRMQLLSAVLGGPQQGSDILMQAFCQHLGKIRRIQCSRFLYPTSQTRHVCLKIIIYRMQGLWNCTEGTFMCVRSDSSINWTGQVN